MIGDVMKDAAFSLAETKFITGDMNSYILENSSEAQIKVYSKKNNVAGTIHYYS